MFRAHYFLFLLILVSSCASRITPKQSVNVPIKEYSEDFSYLLPDYKEVADEKPVTENRIEKPEEIVFKDDNSAVVVSRAKIIEENKSMSNGAGYRIQVFSGNSKTDFENTRGFLLRNYPELDIYESYSHPTYRIKVGDFIHFQDASRYNLLLKERFGVTRILSEKINIKKALNIK